jgi:hypothetical protein
MISFSMTAHEEDFIYDVGLSDSLIQRIDMVGKSLPLSFLVIRIELQVRVVLSIYETKVRYRLINSSYYREDLNIKESPL